MSIIRYTPWLLPEEQGWVVEKLLELGLLKFDNGRKLPLKKGGTTDVYINLRDARSNPEAIKFVAGLFSCALRRLDVARFVEVPDSVSCFAGVISTQLGLPYLTIRESTKTGRVGDANTIGSCRRGEDVAIIDDVVTDGQSKIVPYRECVARGLNVQDLVVIVDRQQGWQSKFAAEEIPLNVWPGMTLHDVRKHLISAGIMERCPKLVEDKNPIIVALDGKSWAETLAIIDPLRPTGCILKANDLLFNEGIERLLPELSVYGRVMADLKSHDIPATVENTCRRLRACPPWAVTVHASGGADMIKAAVKALEGTPTKVLAVTVLTSMDEEACREVSGRKPADQVIQLASLAGRAGAHGFVCSPEENALLRGAYPEMLLVTPGVRSPGADVNDQKRIGTPKQAMANGSTHLVMGRQILGATDPVAEVARVLRDELGLSAA